MNSSTHPLTRPGEPIRIAPPYSGHLPLLRTTQIRKLETFFNEQRSISKPKVSLIELAGQSTARLCAAVAPSAQRVWVACGPGHNGADGLVSAIELIKMGKRPYVSLCGKRFDKNAATSSSESQAIIDHLSAQRAAQACGIVLHDEPPKEWDIAVDALLGIGINQKNERPIQGTLLNWLNLINASHKPVLCVDVPSGLCADTGCMSNALEPSGNALSRPNPNQARYTLTFLGLKPGLFTGDGKDFAGEIWLDTLVNNAQQIDLLQSAEYDIKDRVHLNPSPVLTSRTHNTHKGSYSDVIVLGGALGMQGAAILAATSSLHMGAGRVYLCLLENLASPSNVNPALMTRAASELHTLELESSTVVCGCGGGKVIENYLEFVIGNSSSLVLDADALNAIAASQTLKELLIARHPKGRPTVLTPHPLEAARLLGITTQEVQANRIQSAQALANLFYCTVILKGAGSVIAQYCSKELHARVSINPTGCPLLACAGTGDVLAGMVGALLANKGDPWASACEAVYIHGQTAQDWGVEESFDAQLLSQRITYPRKRN